MTSGEEKDHMKPPQQSHRQQKDLRQRLRWWTTVRRWALCSGSSISVWGVLVSPSFTLERRLWSLWSCWSFGCCSGFLVSKPSALWELYASLSFIFRNNRCYVTDRQMKVHLPLTACASEREKRLLKFFLQKNELRECHLNILPKPYTWICADCLLFMWVCSRG